MNAPVEADFLAPTSEARLAHILGQLYGGRVELVDDPAYTYLLPTLTPFQIAFLEWVLDPSAPDRAAVYGGIGCGKTFGIALAAYVVAMTRPGSYSLLTTDSFENLRDMLLPECRRAFGDDATWGESTRTWSFKNGSTVKLRFYDLKSTQDEAQNPIEGRNISGILLADETQKLPPKLLDHAEERTRGVTVDAAGHQHAPKLALIGRPGAIDWWRRAIAKRGGRVFTPRTRENPHNGPRYIAKLREGRTLADFLCITGEGPAPVKGAVYGGFKTLDEDGTRAYWPRGNLVRHSVCAGPGPVWLALDPGFTNPAVLVIRPVHLLNPLGSGPRQVTVHVVLADLALTEAITSQVIDATRRLLDANGWTPVALVADPAGAARNAQTGESDLALWARSRTYTRDHHGGGLGVRVVTPTDPNKRDVEVGIARVAGLICNAQEPPLRLLCVTDEHWDACERAGTEERNIRNSLLQYTLEIARKKRAGGQDHRSTHHADALRYYVGEGPGTWQSGAPPSRPTVVEQEPWEREVQSRWEEPR